MLLIRWLNLAAISAGLIVWLFWVRSNRDYSRVAIAPLSYLLHLALFTLARILSLPIPIEQLNIWSAAIHLHAAFLLIGAPLIYRRVKL